MKKRSFFFFSFFFSVALPLFSTWNKTATLTALRKWKVATTFILVSIFFFSPPNRK